MKHESDGFLFEAGSPHSLSQYVAKLQANPTLHNEMGEAGRQKVQGERTAEAVACDYVQWYDRTIKRCAP